MALNSTNNSSNDLVAEQQEDVEEIKVIENTIETNVETEPTIPDSGKNAIDNLTNIKFPRVKSPKAAAPSLSRRCRLFIHGGQQRGRNLFRRGRRISKKFGCNFTGTRSSRYLVRNNNACNNGTSTSGPESTQHGERATCFKHGERARRSRLAEDALFYEDTFESSHIHGHVQEESPKSFLQILNKKSKSKGRTKPSSSLSESPAVENCICLKYLNPKKKFSSDDEYDNKNTNPNTSDTKQKESGAIPKKHHSLSSKVVANNDNQNLSETDSLQHDSPKFVRVCKSSVDIGILLSLSLTDPIVTTFNNNGNPERKPNNEKVQLNFNPKRNGKDNNTDTSSTNLPNDPNLSSGHHLNTPTTHTQIDFTNFLIPGQKDIIQCPFYWGKIDRYQAEALLSDKPEGSFLLRDSAQEDFVFSVSFRRYSRSLHARIEEDGHTFSFDSHDPGVHASHSVRGLLEHYKDPLSCMFFEPMLLFPVVRKTCFSLQTLARASICDRTTYGGVSQLPLPKVLKQYLREYNYKHKIRTRYIDTLQDLQR